VLSPRRRPRSRGSNRARPTGDPRRSRGVARRGPGPGSPAHRQLGLLVLELRLGGPAGLGLLGPVLLVGAKVGAAGVEQVDAALDALEGLDVVALQPDEDVDGVLVGAAAD